MKKKNLALFCALACLAGSKGVAQELKMTPCYTDEVRQQVMLKHPELAQIEENYRAQIKEGLKHIDFSKLTKRTADSSSDDNFWYDIPIVVHVIHDYGFEYTNMTDDDIYNDLVQWNIVYAKQNSDTNSVIAPYKGNIPNSHTRYMGNVHFRLHLATKDPLGNPCHGITHHRNYLTYTASDLAKFDDWSPSSYVNIWSINIIPAGNGFQAAAYAYTPPTAAVEPMYDGILCDYSYMPNSGYTDAEVGKTINHEMGHVFNLFHPWGQTNFPQVALGDDDVDDTPPTWGHNPVGCDFTDPSSNVNSVYDSFYATNYFKIYPAVSGGDSLVNYPDTTNTQNIMDYTYCARMFTYGQVERMHAAANSTLANRSNLWSDSNLIETGILNPDFSYAAWPDLKPIPDFCAVPPTGTTTSSNYQTRFAYFAIPGQNVKFINESWNDTLTSLTWTFSNGATVPTQTVTTGIPFSSVINSFSTGGWVTLTMQATGNNTGDTTVTWPNAIFVANPTATAGPSYLQDFNPANSPDVSSWPTFNYYNNEFKWQLNNSVGFGDSYCMEYVGFDSRLNPTLGQFPTTGTPNGDVDDFFSVPFDLSSYTFGQCFLNFLYSGASRSSSALNCTDTLQIAYMVKGGAWITIATLGGRSLDNMGAASSAYVPTSTSNWTMGGVEIPASAISAYTVFRFRYLPGVGQDGESSGNNFYMDNIHFSNWPAAVENVKTSNLDVTLLPNPTGGDAYVVVSDAANTSAQISVSDVTGKQVYATTAMISGSVARVAIPHSAISVPGVYMVQVLTGNQSVTRKLVVY